MLRNIRASPSRRDGVGQPVAAQVLFGAVAAQIDMGQLSLLQSILEGLDLTGIAEVGDAGVPGDAAGTDVGTQGSVATTEGQIERAAVGAGEAECGTRFEAQTLGGQLQGAR